MLSRKDLMGPGLVTEVGGSFIDSTHKDMLQLCAEFGLGLWDVDTLDPAWTPYTFFFDNRYFSEAEVVEAFRPLLPKMEADQKLVGDAVSFDNPGRAGPLDNTNLAEYLDRIGARGWIRSLRDVAFVTEFGLDADDQSCLNMLMLIPADISEGDIAIFGDSDERYKVEGGNMRVTTELEQRLDQPIRLRHRLEALGTKGDAYVLTFQGPGDDVVEVDADFVVLTMPFSLLRNVALNVEMPPYKRQAIQQLGYRTNAKVMAGFTNRIWHEQGYLGYAFSDEPFQLGWDNTLLQPGPTGGITFFSGGKAGLQVGTGSAEQQVQRLLPGMNKVYPGLAELRNGTAFQMPWPKYPYSLGSYSCYRPGQWTTIAGAEIKPVDRILFAGEHCSLDFQGFMNGGAVTGRRAAETILARVAA